MYCLWGRLPRARGRDRFTPTRSASQMHRIPSDARFRACPRNPGLVDDAFASLNQVLYGALRTIQGGGGAGSGDELV